MTSPLLSRAAWRWLVLVVSLAGLLGRPADAWATHIRAGDIQATTDQNDPFHFYFRLTLYSDASASADTPDADIFFGDGSARVRVPRKSKTLLTGAASDSYLSIYEFEHVYNAPGPYKVSFIGENRKENLVNIPNSRDQTFYIYTMVTVNPSIGFNHSAVLNNPALDKASRQQVFVHNPGASDAEGDSLSYELRPSQQASIAEAEANGNVPKPVDCAGFKYPHLAAGGVQVAYKGPPVGVPLAPPIFQQDTRGTIVWNSPETLGDYNVAFVVREWRKTGRRYTLIGEVVRDMQITVRNANNLRPILTVPPDLCVVAGTNVSKVITAFDPNGDPITLTAYGSIVPPNSVSPAASFTVNANGTRGVFRWSPTCANIAAQPYQVTFKAVDNPPASNATPLSDILPWNIRVVGPAPQNVRVSQLGTSAVLNWDSYACQNPGARLLVYRKEGCTISPVDTCQTGIAASSGFVQIQDLPVSAISFIDTGPLDRSKTYSYRLYVQFALPTGGASLASREACLTLDGKPARFTNVTIDNTGTTNGQVTVRWTRPRAGAGNTFADPKGYNLYRSAVTTPPVFKKVRTAPFAFTDTTFVDQGRNTQDSAFVYRLEFFTPSAPTPEISGPASSVRLLTVADPANLSIRLSWTYSVPWDNSQRPVAIFRRDGNTGTFVQIATAATGTTGGSYVDAGTPAAPLRLGGNYCYYVRTDGTYGAADEHLINLSQQRCVLLSQLPCTPILKLKQVNCDSLQTRLFQLGTTPDNPTYTNYLSWTLSSTPANCTSRIPKYELYYRPNQADTTAGFKLLATVTGQSYVHTTTDQPVLGAAYCYYVVALDSAGTRSARSNVVCKDNCPLFLMPNIFTPNGDGRNDKLRPKVASPIRKTRFQVFNRWGVKIYESDADPLINWDGGGPAGESGKGVKVVEGVYYYLAEVEFADLAGTKKTYKGWVEITR